MNRLLRSQKTFLAGALLTATGLLTGCAATAADSYSAREFNFDALLAELQPRQRASTSVITEADIRALPPSLTVEEILAHSAGIYLRRRHEPGGDMTVYVLGSANPLYVIDGVPLSTDGHVPLNSNDVHRMEILKYGAGTALYGFRGSNGVVLITTKKN